jgi:hypothetical protein
MRLFVRQRRIAFACELPEQQARPIVLRCRNWGQQYRLARLRGQANSLEGSFRPDATAGYESQGAPRAVSPDVADAQAIEDAVCIMASLYHNLLLRCWYVRLWSPGKCQTESARGVAMARPRLTGFDADLEMAHALLIAALNVPAVIRKPRAAAIVKELLDAAA